MSEAASFEVVVLSAPSATERRDRVRAMLAGMGIRDWRFFDVVPASGLEIAYSDEVSYSTSGTVLSPAEVSCAASHLAIMEEFLRSDATHVVVLEDDVFLDPNCRLESIVEFAAIAGIWYLKLYARFFVPAHHLMTLARFSLYRPSWPALGTQAYVLSRAGAGRILSYLHATGLRYPIDASMDRYWDNGLPAIVFYPFPVMELLVPTTIHSPHNRSQVDAMNTLLSARPELRLKRSAKLVDALRCRLADRRLQTFDKEMSGTMHRDRKQLARLLQYVGAQKVRASAS
jgi:glycosyl transferase family 25